MGKREMDRTKENLDKARKDFKAEKVNPEATTKIKDEVQHAVRGLNQFQNTLFNTPPKSKYIHRSEGMFDSMIGALIMTGGFSLGMAVHAMIWR